MQRKITRIISSEITHILIMSCAVLVSLVVIRYAIFPMITPLVRTNAECRIYKDLISDNNRYASLKTLLNNKNKQLETIRSSIAFPNTNSANLSSILQLLIAKAKNADIRFVKMLPESATPSTNNTYPVVLEMTTTYQSLGRFIASLETLPHVLRIERLAITSQKNDLDVRILITCFFPTQKEQP